MTKKFPPHLPPDSCNLNTHRLWQRLKLLLFITFFSLVVGMSGASMVLGWLWPSLGSADIWISSYQKPSISKLRLEDKIRKEMSNRIVTVYKSVSQLGSLNYLDKKLSLGEAIIISSDGWIVMYNPDFIKVSERVTILTQNGKIYETEKIIKDIYSGMVYLKIKDSQFKVVNFSDSLQGNDDIFVYQNQDWQHGLLGKSLSVAKDNNIHLDTAAIVNYGVNGFFQAGKIAINNQGRVIGFITKQNQLLPSIYVTRVLSQFLNNKFLQYPSLGIEGWFNSEKPIIVKKQLQTGFAVSRVWSKSNLRVGDVILQIDGLIADEHNLWYIITNNNEVNLKVLRRGKILEFSIPVVKKVIK